MLLWRTTSRPVSALAAFFRTLLPVPVPAPLRQSLEPECGFSMGLPQSLGPRVVHIWATSTEIQHSGRFGYCCSSSSPGADLPLSSSLLLLHLVYCKSTFWKDFWSTARVLSGKTPGAHHIMVLQGKCSVLIRKQDSVSRICQMKGFKRKVVSFVT